MWGLAQRFGGAPSSAMGGWTYAHGFVRRGGVAVGVVLIVGVAARLAREGGTPRAGCCYRCPAKRLHGVWGCCCSP
jgi:hypothetical protein